MKQYEITYLVENEDVVKNDPVAEAVKSLGGKIDQTKRWGQRNLAYPIKKLNTAFYNTAVFEIDSLHLVDLSRQLNLNDKVMRFLIVKDIQIADQEERQFAPNIKNQTSKTKQIITKTPISKIQTGTKQPQEQDEPMVKKEIQRPIVKPEIKPAPAHQPKKIEKIIEKPVKVEKPKVKPTKSAPGVTDEERLKQLEDKLEDLLKS